ncbi:hypothetical protein GEMMAAP_01455 [Gemmatimonas phototrophica]|uniref:S1/P1 Nuclease n=2 Tax=Gemmatimonas phototrophica TaxID=1379270 RepID=A0A143BHD4_9BACT|nr:hypothetical protein GEMMAAP_01455 [Gemmatimonas phototrophica]
MPLGAALLLLSVLSVLFVPRPLNAWGDYGHRLVGLVAATTLPADMPSFFTAAAPQLAYLNPEPDRWKDRAERQLEPALEGGTSPDHFIDSDMVTPLQLAGALAARDRWAFADSIRAAGVSPQVMGFLPFTMLEYTSRLRGDFRLWRIAPDSTVRAWIEQRIIEDAGILGHFVADGSNPHHTTKHYNGWAGENPKGYTTDNRFHGRFESQYVQAHVREPDVRAALTAAPQVFPRTRDAVLAYLDRTHQLVDSLYALEQAATFRPETTTAAQKAFATARLAAGAAMLRDLWYTAWITSARPD